MKICHTLPFALLGAGVIAGLPGTSLAAGFVEDSKATLGLRNFYINRNFTNPSNPQSKA
jgi:hypothetical protein